MFAGGRPRLPWGARFGCASSRAAHTGSASLGAYRSSPDQAPRRRRSPRIPQVTRSTNVGIFTAVSMLGSPIPIVRLVPDGSEPSPKRANGSRAPDPDVSRTSSGTGRLPTRRSVNPTHRKQGAVMFRAANTGRRNGVQHSIYLESPMKVFTTGQVAKICKVAPRTVSKWFDSGRLKGYRIPGSQDRRIPREYLIKFLKEHGMPLGDLEDEAMAKVLIVAQDQVLIENLQARAARRAVVPHLDRREWLRSRHSGRKLPPRLYHCRFLDRPARSAADLPESAPQRASSARRS